MKMRMRSKAEGKKQILLWCIEIFAVLIVLMFLVFQVIVGASRVSGNSMNPTYADGDEVIFYRLAKSFTYGDVVSLRMTSGERYIKRVVACPGDVVELRNGVLYVNGAAEQGSYCVLGETRAQNVTIAYPYTVEAGRYFVLGDNRDGSVDSRTFGTVSQKQILGLVLGGK